MDLDQYVLFLKSLFPIGAAWPREVATQFHALFEAMAEEFVRYDQRVGTDLVNEADPQTTLELLTDWERIVGLPDEVQSIRETVTQRRQDILGKLAFRGGQSRQFFIDLAASFGYTITITEIRPFRAGISRAGDRCYDITWLHHWTVHSDTLISEEFRAGHGRAGDRLRAWQNDTLEAVIQRAKPAQTTVHFTYGG